MSRLFAYFEETYPKNHRLFFNSKKPSLKSAFLFSEDKQTNYSFDFSPQNTWAAVPQQARGFHISKHNKAGENIAYIFHLRLLECRNILSVNANSMGQTSKIFRQSSHSHQLLLSQRGISMSTQTAKLQMSYHKISILHRK